MDGTPGTASAAGPSVTAAHSQSKLAASKPGPTGAQTLNGGTVLMNCHVPGVPQPTVTHVSPADQGSAASAVGTVVRTSPTSAPTVGKSVPTVTLVRPPMQTPSGTPQSGGQPATGVTSPAVSVSSSAGPLVNNVDNTKSAVQPGGHVVAATTRSPTVLQSPRTSVPSSSAAAGARAIAPQVLTPRLSQPQQNAPNFQNIHLPAGMVLVRCESGQLLMIHQQALAQMQAQSQSQNAMTPRPAAPTSTPPVQITSLQAPGASLLARSITPTTIIKQGSAVQTTVTTTTTLQRPPVLQNTVMLGGAVTTPGQASGTPTALPPGSAAAAVTQRVGPLVGPGTPLTPIAITTETLENVKKCRNFLSTLIKLASNGKQSSETTANVKELVKNLLEAKLEPEEFTSRLYQELNSSPQPYLLPFLKRSLPTLRQMTPDPEAFIRQSLVPQASAAAAAASTALTAVVLRPPLSTTATTATSTATTKTSVISLTQTPHSKPAMIVPQQQGTMARTQVTLAQPPMITLRGQSHSRIIVGQPQVVKQLQTGVIPAVRQTLTPGSKGVHIVSQMPLIDAQKNKLREAGGGSFRDDDDINDVASMAGVNLSEESARILATNSELVGAVTRSCKEETFLSTSSLSRRVLEIGKRFDVSELGTDVINYISHVTQRRLQNLLEKVSQVAQQRNINFKEEERYEPVDDVRAQLRFFEQLDQAEKQRKEEHEREILLKAAKSRSRQEDPEQLRLKQKAKEVSASHNKWSAFACRARVFVCWTVPACVPDAAAGAGSDQTERSQPDGAGSHWPEEAAQSGLSSPGQRCRGPRARVVPAGRLRRSSFQALPAAAHHQGRPPGPAALPGERAREQPLRAALQRPPEVAPPARSAGACRR